MIENVQARLVGLGGHDLKVMFVAYPDACRACRSLQARIFDPGDAPPLPLKDCLTPPCRCRYERYDPRSVVSRLLRAGVDAVKQERLEEARELLYQVIDLDERNEKAWLWLGGVVGGINERIICLENVLAINPHHELARQGLRYLMAQRRELGAGRNHALKIKDAREAIDHIKASKPKVSALREAPLVATKPPSRVTVSPPAVTPQPVKPPETPPVPTKPPAEMAVSHLPVTPQPVKRPETPEPQRQQSPVSFPLVFLSVLLAVLLFVLITSALVSFANLLR